MSPIFNTLALFSGLVAAAPTVYSRASGTTFNLLFNGAGNAPAAVSALNTGTWAVTTNAAGNAILVADSSKAALFYEYSTANGTAVATGATSFVITPGGTATVPSTNHVDLLSGDATTGVTVDTVGLATLQYENGNFQACQAKFLDPNATTNDIVLSFYAAGQRRFADCASVGLVSVCSTTGTGEVGKLGTPTTQRCQAN